MYKIYYVYILRCNDLSYYIGVTNDLERRLIEHEFPEHTISYTSSRLPLVLVYVEEFGDIIQAIEREKQLKKWSRKKKEALIEGNFEKLVEFSKAYRDINIEVNNPSFDPSILREPQDDKG